MNREPVPFLPVLLIGLCAVLLPASVAVLFDHPPAHAQSRPPTLLYKSDGFEAETANNNILAKSLKIDREGALRIGVAFKASGVFTLFVNGDPIVMNSGNALAAGGGHTFTWPVSPGDEVNAQTDTSGDVWLKIQASWGDGL